VVRALNFGLFGDRNCRAHGLNGKMSEYHAAVGLAELDIWSQKQKAFRRVASDYERAFEALAIRDRLIQAPTVASCYTLVRCLSAAEADRLSAGMRKEGIGHRTWYGRGLHVQPHFQPRTRGEFPVTESLGSRLVGIPAGPTLSRTQIDTVANAVARYILDYS
jgi:dTDP-4-amino-4,6-dideoxygalactose transaminase